MNKFKLRYTGETVYLYFRYGLPVNFQAMLLLPHKKTQRRLRDELGRLYEHLDNTALTNIEVCL